MEKEFIECATEQQKTAQTQDEDTPSDELKQIESLRGVPNLVGVLEELVDDNHGIVSSQPSVEYYVPIPSFVDRSLLQPGQSVLCHASYMTVVGVLADDQNPLLNVMKVETSPEESYADIGGLEE